MFEYKSNMLAYCPNKLKKLRKLSQEQGILDTLLCYILNFGFHNVISTLDTETWSNFLLLYHFYQLHGHQESKFRTHIVTAVDKVDL